MPTSDHTLAPGQEFDGYQIIRFLGRGGFGEVWLCRSEVMNGYHALKFIAGANADLLKKEFQALALYRKEASKLRSPNLVPIEHINRYEARLFYVMPLADGITETDPADANWQPLSLADTIHARISSPAWFSSGEILNLMQPLLLALQTLSDAGLVHRDVKPENILFSMGHRASVTSACWVKILPLSPGAALPVMPRHHGTSAAYRTCMEPPPRFTRF